MLMLSAERYVLKVLKFLVFQASHSFFSVEMIILWLCARDIAGFGVGEAAGVASWATARDAHDKSRPITTGSSLFIVRLLLAELRNFGGTFTTRVEGCQP